MTRDAEDSVQHAQLATRHLATYAREQLGGRQPFHWPVEFPEVFGRGGFDAIVGNPPFMGNKKITGTFGADYRDYMVAFLAYAKTGLADLCTYFLLRADILRRVGGTFGLIATDTIAQGDTREVGLEQICRRAVIYRAIRSLRWPGMANVVVSVIWSINGKWSGDYALNDKSAPGIDSLLKEPKAHAGSPKELLESKDWGFIGSYLLGTGFILTPEEAKELIRRNFTNADAIKPYLGGEDLNQDPDGKPTRMVICFWDWPLDRETAPDDYTGPVASHYPDCLNIVRTLVKPERDKKNRLAYRHNWWRFAELSKRAYEMTAGFQNVLIRARVSPIHAFSFVPASQIYSEQTVVFRGEWDDFGLLQSNIHEAWAVEYSTTKGSATIVYAPSACLITFPRPRSFANIEQFARRYFEFRRECMLVRQVGLTDTYNRFHDAAEISEDITRLRKLHAEMDRAVTAAYGWNDLDLGHGFHETKQGVRYTISEPARRIVLDRLLALNHQRHAEEEAENVANAASAPVKRGRKKKDRADKLTLDLL
jgi:hypothetical protein